MQRRNEGNVAARHRFEKGVAIEWKRQPLRAPVLPTFRGPAQVQPGAEIVAMAEDDAAFCFLAGAIDRFAQLPHHRRIEAVALVRTIEPDQGDLALQLVGDRLFFAHDLLLVSTGKSSPRRDHHSWNATSSGRRTLHSAVVAPPRSRTATTAASPA